MFGLRKNTWAPRLGQLELKVMEVIWQGEQMAVRDVVEALGDPDMAVSTMQTTLERLARKGLVSRSKHGRAFVYAAAVTRADLITLAMRDLAEDVATGRLEPLVAGFVGLLEQLGPDSRQNVLKAIETRLRD